ncbi:MAG: cysteine desulfurase [Chloroflexota bacterium]|nr:cysteine desulfurase [Chloroflexota bacterium]
MIRDTIYLDHAATTPVDAEVVAAMLPFFGERFGNPSAVSHLGQEARAAVDRSRATIAAVLGCRPAEVIVTGGATESDGLALAGAAWAARFARPDGPWPHLVTTAIEHSAVLESARLLERQGFSVTVVPCDADGRVAPGAVAAALRPETCLVSTMLANNETGAIQPVREIAALCRERGIAVHTDAVQAAGLLPLKVDDLGVDLLTLSAHKFYGPKGVGLLFVRAGTAMAWTQRGGGQEGGRRGGTENTAGIVGMAVALAKAEARRPEYVAHCVAIRDALVAGIAGAVPGVELNGPPPGPDRLPNNANLAFPGIQGETLLLALDMEGIAASAGSACTAGKAEPSHVLEAMGLSDERCRSSVRFTVGWDTTAEDVDETVGVVAGAAARVLALSGRA